MFTLQTQFQTTFAQGVGEEVKSVKVTEYQVGKLLSQLRSIIRPLSIG